MSKELAIKKEFENIIFEFITRTERSLDVIKMLYKRRKMIKECYSERDLIVRNKLQMENIKAISTLHIHDITDYLEKLEDKYE